jgi:hypothetical protein
MKQRIPTEAIQQWVDLLRTRAEERQRAAAELAELGRQVRGTAVRTRGTLTQAAAAPVEGVDVYCRTRSKRAGTNGSRVDVRPLPPAGLLHFRRPEGNPC